MTAISGHLPAPAARRSVPLAEARLDPLECAAGSSPMAVAMDRAVMAARVPLARLAATQQPPMAYMNARIARHGSVEAGRHPTDRPTTRLALTECGRSRVRDAIATPLANGEAAMAGAGRAAAIASVDMPRGPARQLGTG